MATVVEVGANAGRVNYVEFGLGIGLVVADECRGL